MPDPTPNTEAEVSKQPKWWDREPRISLHEKVVMDIVQDAIDELAQIAAGDPRVEKALCILMEAVRPPRQLVADG